MRWIYDYIGVRAVLFLFNNLPLFEKAHVKYGIRHHKETVEVWINWSKDGTRHISSFEGHPTDVVYSLTALGDMIQETSK